MRFVLLPTGSSIAVQTKPGTGTVAVTSARRGVLRGHVISADRPAPDDAVRYRAHAAACPARPEPASAPEPPPTLF